MRQSSLKLGGFNISPPFRVGGGHLYSMRGPIKTVLSFAAMHEWIASQVVAFGQNGHKPGMTEVRLQGHLIILTGCEEMAEVGGSVDHQFLHAAMQDGFDYANLIAGFTNGVQLVNFGAAFAINPFAELITNLLFKTFFTETNQVKHCQDATNVLLLIGEGGERTLAAKIAHRDHTFKLLPSPNVSTKESRHVIVGRNILLAAGYDTNQVHGTDADAIVVYLTENDNAVLVWAHARIGYHIEDMAVVTGSRENVILTLSEGDFRLVPAIVRLHDDNLQLIPSTADGVKMTDLNGRMLSPLVRVFRYGREVILVERNAGEPSLFFNTPDALGASFSRMVHLAAADRLSARNPIIL